jgi:hypothetical protein
MHISLNHLLLLRAAFFIILCRTFSSVFLEYLRVNFAYVAHYDEGKLFLVSSESQEWSYPKPFFSICLDNLHHFLINSPLLPPHIKFYSQSSPSTLNFSSSLAYSCYVSTTSSLTFPLLHSL